MNRIEGVLARSPIDVTQNTSILWYHDKFSGVYSETKQRHRSHFFITSVFPLQMFVCIVRYVLLLLFIYVFPFSFWLFFIGNFQVCACRKCIALQKIVINLALLICFIFYIYAIFTHYIIIDKFFWNELILYHVISTHLRSYVTGISRFYRSNIW